MGFKSEQKNLTFSDLERSFKDEKNRSLKTLMNLQKTILWDRIESILLKDYPVGHKKEGCLNVRYWNYNSKISSWSRMDPQISVGDHIDVAYKTDGRTGQIVGEISK